MMCRLSTNRLSILALFLLEFVSVGCLSDRLERFKRASRVKRIIGGEDISEGDWPWLVHLTGKIPSRSFWGMTTAHTSFYCGGSVINKRWILTAAHCFVQPGERLMVRQNILTPKHWHVKAGEISRKHSAFDRVKSMFGSWFRISSWQMYYEHAAAIHLHHRYDGKQNTLWPHDIALIKLTKDLPIGVSERHVNSIRIPSKNESTWPRVGQDCAIKGWGCTTSGGRLPNVAKAVTVPVKSTAICTGIYRALLGRHRICAGPEFENKGICPGDSGGPLVCKGADGTWTQAGIASFTSGNNPGENPAVYTRVSEYEQWINDVINSN